VWGNYTYNDTAMTLLMAGKKDGRLYVEAVSARVGPAKQNPKEAYNAPSSPCNVPGC
jgi:hypothetical protein